MRLIVENPFIDEDKKTQEMRGKKRKSECTVKSKKYWI